MNTSMSEKPKKDPFAIVTDTPKKPPKKRLSLADKAAQMSEVDAQKKPENEKWTRGHVDTWTALIRKKERFFY